MSRKRKRFRGTPPNHVLVARQNESLLAICEEMSNVFRLALLTGEDEGRVKIPAAYARSAMAWIAQATHDRSVQIPAG